MPRSKNRHVIGIRNGTHRASLQPRKVYRVLDDPKAETHQLLRVIDESGEDYLFPASLFASIVLPIDARHAFGRTVTTAVTRPARRSKAAK